MKTNIKLIVAVAIGIFCFTFTVKAQQNNQPNQNSASQTAVVATVGIQEAKIVSQDRNKFKLSFILTNSSGVQSGIQYSVKLVPKGGNTNQAADEKIYAENISLTSGEKLNKEIEYQAPDFLKGDYTIWIFAVNSRGMMMGLGTAGNATLNGSGQNIKISSCNLTVKGDQTQNDFAKSGYPLLFGVDVAPSEELDINCQIMSGFDKTISFVPQFENYFRSTSGEKLSAQKQDAISLNAGEIKNITLVVPKATKPQSYDAVLSFLDTGGKVISKKITAHYVVQGFSGTIQNLILDKASYKKGDAANLSVFITGSADSFPGRRGNGSELKDANLVISVVDTNGNSCSEKSSKPFSNDSETNFQINIPINADCASPQAVAEFKDKDGNLLDQNNFQTASEKTNQNTSAKYINKIVMLVLGLLLLVILIVFIVKKAKKGNLPPRGMSFFILAFLIATGLICASGVSAYGAPTLSAPVNGAIIPNGSSSVNLSWNPGAGFTSGDISSSDCAITIGWTWDFGYYQSIQTCVSNANWYALSMTNPSGQSIPLGDYQAMLSKNTSLETSRMTGSGTFNWKVSAKTGTHTATQPCARVNFDAYSGDNVSGSPVYVCAEWGLADNSYSPTGGVDSSSFALKKYDLPIVNLSVNSNLVFGQSTTINWSSQLATSCTASKDWSGSKPTSGSESTGAVTAPKTYHLSCTGPGGTTDKEVKINLTGWGDLNLNAPVDGVELTADTLFTWDNPTNFTPNSSDTDTEWYEFIVERNGAEVSHSGKLFQNSFTPQLSQFAAYYMGGSFTWKVATFKGHTNYQCSYCNGIWDSGYGTCSDGWGGSIPLTVANGKCSDLGFGSDVGAKESSTEVIDQGPAVSNSRSFSTFLSNLSYLTYFWYDGWGSVATSASLNKSAYNAGETITLSGFITDYGIMCGNDYNLFSALFANQLDPNGNPIPPEKGFAFSGAGSTTFTAPSVPGTYYIRIDSYVENVLRTFAYVGYKVNNPNPPAGVCGNGTVESGEACDNGANNGICPKTCSSSCAFNVCGPYCGDGTCNGAETCSTCPSDCTCPPGDNGSDWKEVAP